MYSPPYSARTTPLRGSPIPSGLADPTGLSQLWWVSLCAPRLPINSPPHRTTLSLRATCRYVDALEKQVADGHARNRELLRSAYGQRPTYGKQRPDLSNALAAERSHRSAAVEGQRALQDECVRLHEEKQDIENEAFAYQERMEATIGTFEAVLEQAARDKEAVYEQLLALKQQLEAERRNGDALAEERWRGRLEEARELHARELGALRLELAEKPPQLDSVLDLAQENRLLKEQCERTTQLLAAAEEASAAAEGSQAERLQALETELTVERRSVREAAQAAAAAKEEAAAAKAEASTARSAAATAREEAAEAQELLLVALGKAEAARAEAEAARMQTAEVKAEVEAAKVQADLSRFEAEVDAAKAHSQAQAQAQMDAAKAKSEAQALHSEEVALTQQVAALESELALERGSLASAKETIAAARQEARVARGEEKDASFKLSEMEAQLATALQEGAAATSLRTRVASMSRMLEEQQQELADHHRLAATMKLSAAVGGRAGSSLAHAVERWRRACALLSVGQQQSAALSGKASEHAMLSQQVAALEAELAAEREALASAEAVAAQARAEVGVARAEADAARHEVSSAHAEDDEASLKMTQMAAQLAAASEEGSVATSLRTKVASMSRMLEEQQQELADGYLMAATAKLGAALGGHAGSSLAHAMETWRRASALLSAAAQQPEQGAWAKQEAEYLARIQRLEQDFRRTEKDNRGMALLVSDLETQLAAQKSTDGTAPAPTEGRRARPPISPYVSPSVSRESSRPSSPKPAPSELEASLHSAARKPRSSSPQRTSVADQLHRHHHEYSQHSRA